MVRALLIALVVLGLAACGRGTKEEIVAKAREVVFLIVGDTVTLQAAGSPEKPK
jgi:hypothetical protein